MNCIFNDLSFIEFVTEPEKISPAFRNILDFQAVGRTFGQQVLVHHKALYDTSLFGKPFRTIVNSHIKDPEIKRRIYILLDKSTPCLPDDTAIPGECNFFYSDRAIPCTGLAECAFRQFMGEQSFLFGLPCDLYNKTVLPVQFSCAGSRNSVNVFNVDEPEAFKEKLDEVRPPILNWEQLLERVELLPYIRIEDSVRESLRKEPFESSLCRAINKRIQIISQLANSTPSNYHDLIQEYCHGERAWFSDESQTRINLLKDKLFFTVNGTPQRCSYHGKVSYRTIRIHMDKKPVPGEFTHIVYIGYKIL